MSTNYVTPPENTCPPGTGSTFTEELGRHCVELFTTVTTKLPDTGLQLDPVPFALSGAALLGAGLLMLLFRRKDRQ